MYTVDATSTSTSSLVTLLRGCRECNTYSNAVNPDVIILPAEDEVTANVT